MKPGDEILVPGYHQGAEIEAFHRYGLKCRFYGVDERLAPRQEHLDRLLGSSTRALHIIHYWGFPQDVARWRRWCDAHGLFLVEDGAQALLASSGGFPVGTESDLAVFCLYKSFGLPDGAAAICRVDLPAPHGARNLGLGGFTRRLGSALSARSRMAALIRSRLIPEREAAREEGEFLPGEIDLGDPGRRPSVLATVLIPRIVSQTAATRRRTNYERLLRDLGGRVPQPFRRLPAGAVPIAFPLETTDATRGLSALRSLGISAGILWPTRHSLVPVGDWWASDHFRAHVIALPVHQELAPADLDRIVDSASLLPRFTAEGIR